MTDTKIGIDKEKKMQEYDIKASKFNGTDTVDFLINLATDISNAIPNISFKPKNMNNWGVDKDIYPDGVCESMFVFHNNDLNNHIGTLEVSNYYREKDKPKYGITSINIDDGRRVYGYNRNEGQFKYSIHTRSLRYRGRMFWSFRLPLIGVVSAYHFWIDSKSNLLP